MRRADAGVGRGHREVAHLAAAPRLGLAVQVQVHPGQREHGGPRRRHRRAAAVGKPQVAQQVQHHRRRVQPRHHQRQAGQRAHLQLELRDVAAVDAVVARVVRARRHLVGQQRAVGEHEEFDAQHPDVIQGSSQARGGVEGGKRRGLVHIRRRHLRHRQDAVAVQVLLQRQVDHGPAVAARNDDAELEAQVQPPLQHAGHATQGLPGGSQLTPRGDSMLALAVVAQAGGLEQPGQQIAGRRSDVRVAFHARMLRTRNTRTQEERFLCGAVLATFDRIRRRRHTARRCQSPQRCGRHVLELRGHRRARPAELRQRSGINVGCAQMLMRHCARGAVWVRVEHQNAVSKGLRGVGEHAA
jgi:hypothetical protein